MWRTATKSEQASKPTERRSTLQFRVLIVLASALFHSLKRSVPATARHVPVSLLPAAWGYFGRGAPLEICGPCS